MATTPLSAEQVRTVRTGLAQCLDEVSGLDDEGRVESIRALEELVCTATAAQAALAAELDSSLRAAAADADVRPAEQGRGIGHVVAAARRESPSRGGRHLQLATIVASELPHTWKAWRAGHITEWMATIIARETAYVSLAHRLAIDAAVCGDLDALDALEAMGIGQLTGRVKSMSEELDPAAAVKRRRHAESERRVSLRPAPDTMTWLSALLPVKEGVAVLAALTAAADTARAGGDDRTQGQVMADTLVDAVLGHDGIVGRVAERGTSEAYRDQPRPRPRVNLDLVMSDAQLFGGDDTPAHLAGFGPIPAELAREIVCDALGAGERVWLKRLYTDPDTDQLIQTDSHARLFPPSMARFVRLRDQTCRTPWCDAPVRHVDHVEDHADGGPTTLANAQGLCEACSQAKNAHRWRARPGPEGQVKTTHPAGPGHVTRPPRWSATIHQRPPRRLTIDYYVSA